MHQFFYSAVATIVYVIIILQLNEMLGNRTSVFAVMFKSTAGKTVEGTVHFFDHNPKAQEIEMKE